jgi:hypothetical protein
VIRCNNNPQHLRWEGGRCQTEQESWQYCMLIKTGSSRGLLQRKWVGKSHVLCCGRLFRWWSDSYTCR